MKKEDIKSKIPKIKKKIYAFLVGEEGKISKQSLLKAGIVLGTLGILSGKFCSATDTLSLGTYDGSSATATHTSHSSHSSHSSHGSHGSHGSW